MSKKNTDDLELLFQQAEEYWQAEQPEPNASATHKATAVEFLREIRNQREEPSDSEFADRFIGFCSEARAAGLAMNPLTPTELGHEARLALRIVDLAEAGDKAGIVAALRRLTEADPRGANIMQGVIALFQRRLDSSARVYGLWEEAESGVPTAEGDSAEPIDGLQEASRPKWERTKRLLTLDDAPTKIADREAPVLFNILDLLEDAGWPSNGVSVPKGFVGSIKDGVDSLNEKTARRQAANPPPG